MNALVPLFEQFTAVSVRASALIACVLLLRWLLRGRVPAQCFHLLWLLVAVRLLLPVAPSSPTSVFNLFQARTSVPAAAPDPQWRVRHEQLTPASAAVPLPAAESATPPAQEKRAITGRTVLALVWIAGVLAQVALLAFAVVKMRRALAGAELCSNERVNTTARQCAAALRLKRRFSIWETAAVASPAVIGLWRPRLLLPPGFAEQLSDAQLRFVLLHELAHLRRHDLAALWLLTAARIVHWFNPLVWLATRTARTDAELACDETVLRHTQDASRISYGETLLHLARQFQSQRSALPAAGILESKSAMHLRIARVTSYAAPTRFRAAAAALLVLGVGVVFAADEERSVQEEPRSSTAAAAASASAEQPPPPIDPPAHARPQIEIASRFIETTDTGLQRIRGNSKAVEFLRAIPRGGADEKILTQDEAAEIVRLLLQVWKTDLLTAPRVTTKVDQRAVIEIIREFRYPIEWRRGGENEQPWVPAAFETRNLGVTLEVEPQLASPDEIVLMLRPQVVELLGSYEAATGKSFPVRRTGSDLNWRMQSSGYRAFTFTMDERGVRSVFSSRKVETTVTLKPGETLLFTDLPETEEVQPFKSPARAKRLLVLVTARVIDPEEQLSFTERAKAIILPELDVRDARASKAIQQVRDGSGLEILQSFPDGTEERRITLSLRQVSALDALRQIARLGELDLTIGLDRAHLKPKGAAVDIVLEMPADAAQLVSAKAIDERLFGSKDAAPGSDSKTPADAAPAKPDASAAALPVGIPVVGEPGYVHSPYAPDKGYVDVRGFPPGTKIRCPYSSKQFRVP